MEPRVDEPITEQVRQFYGELPFRFWSTAERAAEAIRSQQPAEGEVDSLPCSEDAVLRAIAEGAAGGDASVLELGCGTGIWLNRAAHHFGVNALGVDVTEGAIARAMEIASALGVAGKATFRVADLFAAQFGRKFRLVRSVGVFHHTADCRRAVRIAASLVEEGGYLFVGLYHKYGRRPFLDMVRPYREAMTAAASADERAQIEDDAFRTFRDMTAGMFPDEVLLRSWFRDQVLHPHETQHTLEEVDQWFREEGLHPYAAILEPDFKAALDLREIFRFERRGYEAFCRRDIESGKYRTGFLALLGTRLRKPSFE